MLNVEFCALQDGSLVGFCIKGHCGFSESGTDIVCAAVSSAVYMVVNTFTDILGVSPKGLYVGNGEMRFIIHKHDESQGRLLFQGLKLHLSSLEEIYPKSIKVNYVEVV